MKQIYTKLMALLLACLLACSLGVAASAATVKGDVNGDGECTVLDVLLVLQSVLHDRQDEGRDVNGDGKVSLADVIQTLKLTASTEAPSVGAPESGSTNVTVENGTVKEAVSLNGENVSAAVPAGVAVEAGATALTLSVTAMDDTSGNITPGDTETAISYDVHIDGVAETNTVPIVVDLGAILPVGQNLGTVSLYHVENGTAVKMTQVMSLADLDAHNEFYYYPATGTVFVALATFSEIAIVNDIENAWEGNFDYSWYANATAPLSENDPDYVIANADQLAAFGAIVGGMNGQTQNSFAGKTVKLLADINLGDKESENNPDLIFYPIGYYNSEGTYERTNTAITSGLRNFEGIFDGAGHTISNFYQNTWEMKGDHDWYDAALQYYRDGMGLFGKVYGGTVKNLTVDNFSSDGEIATTGVIAAYADCNAIFENIAITNCNPRVYNIGNGGIVGCVGWYAKEADGVVTFKNITVDNSNKISALWGSYDVACGGIVGQYYPTSGQSSANYPANGGIHFANCHVAAVMDVYNDVCANYQYYAYRYTGMMIGSIRENTTNEAGKTIPNMAGISATGCTVNYGDWNDYYYCEFEKNSMASYSEDYQFSRVPHSELNFTDSNGNGLVDADERASVTGCKHTHTAEEDKQAIYLPFHQLFTGYGWGVNSIGLEKYSGIVTNLDITEGDTEESAVKFVKADTAKESYTTGTAVTFGELFKAVDNVVIDVDNVKVFASPIGEDSTAGAVAALNSDDWTQSTLTFSGVGKASITIQDYYFCTPTTIEVTVEAADKFESKFTGDFLYRVGNQNTVALGSLFGEIETEIALTSVNVAIESIAGDANGTYTTNTSDWTQGTIQFSDTGVVKVTISAIGAKDVELVLEVIDATNITTATGTTSGGNFVLLNDVNTSNYVYYWNSNLYGNGFTYSLNGAPTNYSSSHGHGILITQNAVLDNLVIVGDVYDEYGAYTNNNDYNAAIDVLGETTIQNCYISGCSAPISTRANATITNTTLYGGAVANLLIKGGTVTLEDVTTANYNDGRNAPIGMGIVIHADATETAKLILNGTLTQYNFLNEEDTPTDTYAKNLHSTMFGDSLSQYHFGTSPNRRVNTGIVSLAATFNGEDITDNANTGYVGESVTVSGVNGYVYTQLNTSGAVNNDYNKTGDSHVATTQGPVPPSYSFDYTAKNYVAKQDGSNDYCYEENGTVYISMDEGDSFSWDASILTIGKNITDYTVSMNGTDYTGKSIAFNEAGDYEVVYTYTDPYNFGINENGDITTYDKTYTQTVQISVAVVKDTTKHAEFTMGSSNAATEKITVDNATYISATGVTADNSTWTYITIDGQKIYYPIVAAKLTSTKGSSTYAYFPVFENVITITDYADSGTGYAFTYNSGTTTLPSGLTAVKGIYKAASDVPYWYNLTNSTLTQSGASKIFKWASSSDAPSDPTTYNNVLCYKSPQISADRVAYITLVQYSYTDEANTTYYYYVGYTLEAFTKQTTCVTPDTLVTLADGTQKRIDETTSEDLFLVWDFFNGEYASAPASIIDNHGYNTVNVVTVNFANGATVNTINGHGFFDAELNKFVLLDENNVADYVGHTFLVQSDDGFAETVLESYSIEEQYTEVWSILTAEHYNCVLEGMLTLTAAQVDNSPAYLMPFTIGDDMKYDAEAMAADIAEYGLYTYEEFADLITYEQFAALNLQYFKVSVGKGAITYDEILYLLDLHMTSKN